MPIKLIVPFSAGGQSDIVARLIAERLQSGLGQPVIIENVAGAGGMIAAARVLRADPDGYTLLMPNASTLTIVPYLQKDAPVKPDSFAPISTVSQFPLVLVVNSQSPYKTLKDVINAAKSTPQALTFASPGYGTTPHLMGELLNREADIALTHVPYKGGAPALNDLIAGRVDIFFEAPATVLPYLQTGKLRALAVTGESRAPLLPQIPTVAEQGMPQLALASWSAFVAPAGTPPAIVERLRTEVEMALKSEQLVQKLQERGYGVITNRPAELAKMIQDEGARWAKLIKDRNITMQ
ncbi:tripartite tricarboxylate transporter substrate binding protein [Achromobacter sp. NFACC18-2]|uniref:Bug family tripartite tricarboxylate transporter substrate binding protein n=1 Tax=Achromobacter sp. NFACC18-2 TaxID=1564112 RepID=UPI0015871B42|nr:tripartite tricarboxylate transporter substrate binding protein [Achromobacter sp. NFACC18-2]